MDNVVTISANTVTKPIGAETPTDALGVTKRMSTSNADTQEPDATKPKYRDPDWLRNEYLYEKRSVREIAQKCGCSHGAVSNWLKRHGIKTRPKGGCRADKRLEKKDWLREQYVEQEKCTREIAGECGCTKKTVRYWLKKNDIETRPKGGGKPDERVEDEAWLRERYVEHGRSIRDIAEECACSGRTVGRWLDHYGIETRSTPDPNENLSDKDWLHEQYIEKKNTMIDIAQKVGCTRQTVSKWVKKHGLQSRGPGALTGPKNPNWKGGRVPYGPGWNKRKKRQVRERDGHKCVDCGMIQAEHKDKYGEKLHVHHLRKARDVDDPEERNAPENLVTLCRGCHPRWESIAGAGLFPDHPAVK